MQGISIKGVMAGTSDQWTREENKAFEVALAANWNCIEKGEWEKIASSIPGKSIDQIKAHFRQLLDDVAAIEDDQVPFPSYADEDYPIKEVRSGLQDGKDCGGEPKVVKRQAKSVKKTK